MDALKVYRSWFWAATVYNLVWGVAVSCFPGRARALAGLPATIPLPIIQVIAMMVGVYAIGYWLMARDPIRYSGNIWVGLAGKTLGPLGFFYFAVKGELPWTMGWTILTNDLVWWPAFWMFALKHGRTSLGES
ncbi:MAG: alkyl hydroperoxide reductase [Armatimonadetes bacterium]|nr:alkyl hydroperoxide reductase [Armatimonadota bacterium]